jgi:predicted 3-demethylubiquinone-9 3-methyltransferase (glyoxalase superfamily)
MCEAFSFQVATADQAETDRYWIDIAAIEAARRG